MTATRKGFSFGDLIVTIVFLASPLASIFFRTFKAIYADYYQGLLTDPGHRWIAFLNHLLVIAVIGGTVTLYLTNPDPSFGAPELFRDDTVFKLAFAQFSGWLSFVLLYAISTVVHLYGTHREDLIRKINVAYKVW